ncbi:uncharacterized protein LOC110033173 [Phalaenopsis equestris]|uniref:uncharacterized protein LOC110033173 n=1 Tax=Phalaenopsis equestris TaxID=78828 RepID=UPI0009E54B3C|nr:uncharacterized protein LOC110033173 [Phalaenopsis equestris]
MSVYAPSCSSRWPQQNLRCPSAFRATSPTLVLSDFYVKRSRCFSRIFAAKEADKPVKKKSGKRKGPEKPYLVGDEAAFHLKSPAAGRQSRHPSPVPKPPAGFVLDDCGRVLFTCNKRIATIVDATNDLPLECVIRRVFQSSHGDECMLLCPVDTPVQILKSTNFNGWSAVNDDEVEAIIPSAAYALAKIHMHLVVSGFCYTARGGFFYSEEDIIELHTDDGQEIDGLPTEGLEITCFNLDGMHYMIYTPSDPLLFVAIKDKNGILHIAEDDLLEDPAIVRAIDEETEFNALVEEEAALLESLMRDG